MARLIERVEAMVRGEIPVPAANRLIGFHLISVEPGKAVFELETGPQHANLMGTLHGGILCDVADAAMGVAYASDLADGETFTTLELKINFLKPVWIARLNAVARVVKRGKTVGLVECDVVDQTGSLVARASSTCLTLAGKKAEGR